MKLLLAFLLVAGAPFPSAQADGLTGAVNQAVRLFQAGEIDLAEARFRQILEVAPNHPQARYYLLEIQGNRDRFQKNRIQTALERVILPKVDLVDTTPTEAVEALRLLVEQQTQGRFVPNIVVRTPPEGIAPFSFKLNQVPASFVLEYIANFSRLRIRYEQHAVVLSPPAGVTLEKPIEAQAEPELFDPFRK
ncbi:MAG: hypothetical protein AAF555_04880 [Verrucomicrobiota bacterium]